MKNARSVKGGAADAPAKIRLLLVEDHAIVREGLSAVISREPDMEVCGQAGNAFDALELVAGTQPDVVLVDITIEGKNGLELIKDLHVQHPEVATLALSMHDETLYAGRVLRAGGRGYIMKDEGAPRLLAAIRQVFAGGIAVSPKVADKMLKAFSGRGSDLSPMESLTDRELEVFGLIGLGKDNQGLADCLHISPKTADVHRAKIKEKLRIATTAELIAFAARWVQTHGGTALGGLRPET